jgi:peptidoglycan/LPS O-acetylase OafA/YrhL
MNSFSKLFSGLSGRFFYKISIYRIPEYLIGMICGYVMHTTRTESKPSKKMLIVSNISWIVAIVLMYNCLYNNKPLGLFGSILNANRSIYRSIWALSICTIVFGCHQLGTGEIVRWFLSLNMWQPLSKLTLAIYLVHTIYLGQTSKDSDKKSTFGMWFTFMLHVGDILVSFVLGAAVYLSVEAPAERILGMKWSRMNEPSRNASSKDSYEYTKLEVSA